MIGRRLAAAVVEGAAAETRPSPDVEAGRRVRGLPVDLRSVLTRIGPPWFLAVAGASFVWWSWFVARTTVRIGGIRYFVLFDDAMISMRFARNLVDGDGLVWNAGEPPVEGFTNPLWTAWMAVLHLVPVPDRYTSLLVMVSCVLLLLLVLWVVHRLAVELAPSSTTTQVAAVVLTATFYPLAYWTLRGMEVGLMVLLLSGATLVAFRLDRVEDPAARRRLLTWLAALGALATATRMDGAIPVACIVAYVVWRASSSDRRATAVRTAVPILATVVAMFLARRAYYGEWLPNTYYLKLADVPLDDRLDVGFLALRRVVVVQLSGLVICAALAFWSARRSPRIALLAVLVLGQAAYSVWVGGDAWEHFSYANRYLATAAPFLCLLAGAGVAWVAAGHDGRRLGGLLLGAAAALGLAAWVGGGSTLMASIDDHDRYDTLLTALAGSALVLGLLLWRRRWRAPAASLTAGLIVAGLVLGTNVQAVSRWKVHNAQQLDAEIDWTARGVITRRITSEGSMVAASQVGAFGYFVRRPVADFLGKSDPHIARLPFRGPRDALRPGHDKMDIAWTIDRYDPAIILLPFIYPDQDTLDAGYEGLDNRGQGRFLYARPGDRRVLVPGWSNRRPS